MQIKKYIHVFVVSYLDLNFTLLLALMQFCTMMLKTKFSSKVDLTRFGNKLFNCVIHCTVSFQCLIYATCTYIFLIIIVHWTPLNISTAKRAYPCVENKHKIKYITITNIARFDWSIWIFRNLWKILFLRLMDLRRVFCDPWLSWYLFVIKTIESL